jgi:hypothetical protein
MQPTSFVLRSDEREHCLKILRLFTIDGESADKKVTEGQLLIFAAIVLKKSDRIQIITSTQYGKSLIVALACVYLSCIDGELISIPAPTKEKGNIIMRYYLQHLGDHPLFYNKLEKTDKVDRLLMETTKDRLILRNRGGIFVLSVQAGNSQKGFEAAMGEGSKTVIEDESCLIPDIIEATIFRMIAGKKDAMYVKIGNPFYRNHFYESSRDPRYLQIFIDFKQALKEGRYSYDFIEEARTKPNFDVLFECKFPAADKIGADGYIRLLTDLELANCYTKEAFHAGYKVLGVDPAAGGDNSAIVLKSGNLQEIRFNQKLKDTMDLVSVVSEIYYEDKPECIAVDATGIGKGVYDRMKQMDLPVVEVNFGASAESDMFYNRKAELYWKERQWLLTGGKLWYDSGWEDAETIKYKNKDGKIFMQPKDELLRQGIASPNCFDAACLTMDVSQTQIKSKRIVKYQSNRVFHDAMEDIWKGK